MWKIHKSILAAVLVAVMLIGSTVGIALAQEDADHGRRDALASQVAELLGINQQDLEDAFKQAQGELREEALDARLQQLVDEGTLTQAQADEYKAWTEARPDIPMVGPRTIRKMVHEGIITEEQVDQYKAWMEAKPDIPRIWPTKAERLVDEGILTQGQVDEYKAWMEARPDVPRVGPRVILKLVNEGTLTQEQADAYKAWVEARPDAPKIDPGSLRGLAAKGQDRRDALTTRVAEILGIDQQSLEDAFKQAQSELQGKALDTRLQQLVDNGRLTQEQAGEYKTWIKARPDIPRIWPPKLRR